MIGCLLINPKFDFSSNKHDDKIVAHDYRQLGLCNHLDKNTGEKIIATVSYLCVFTKYCGRSSIHSSPKKDKNNLSSFFGVIECVKLNSIN